MKKKGAITKKDSQTSKTHESFIWMVGETVEIVVTNLINMAGELLL